MIVQRGERIGLRWEQSLQEMKQLDWDAALQQVQNPALTYPDYYTQPFHAYKQVRLAGMLSLMGGPRHAAVIGVTRCVRCNCGSPDYQLFNSSKVMSSQTYGSRSRLHSVWVVECYTILSACLPRCVLSLLAGCLIYHPPIMHYKHFVSTCVFQGFCSTL